MSPEFLPKINATLNGTSAILLIVGLILIKNGNWRAHAYLMSAATITSILFLICYVIHKSKFGERSIGLQPGVLKNIYLFLILLPHVLLAIVMLPMIVAVLMRAYWRQWDKHRALAKPTFFIWLYVSVTGVIIYWMLYVLFPKM